MTFIVEDGTIVAGANSYASVEYADGYFATRGNYTWTGYELEKRQSYLVLATDYIGIRWGAVLRGVPATETQPLLFPRVYSCAAIPEYPHVLLKATCEYAFRVGQSVSGMLAPDIAYDETGRLVTKKVEEVGPIREETSWATTGSGSQPTTFIPYPGADAFMRTLLRSGSGQRVVRS